MSEFIEQFHGKEDIAEEFRIPEETLEPCTILLAWYGYGDYCGSSFVLFEKDGKLFEVNGSHCSCYGLENQWEPEETSWGALKMRDFGCREEGGANEAQAALEILVAQHLPVEVDPEVNKNV